MDALIAEHGGRIANTAGDSVLAEFPSAVDAVTGTAPAIAAAVYRLGDAERWSTKPVLALLSRFSLVSWHCEECGGLGYD